MSGERGTWKVVTNDGDAVFVGMFRESNAQMKADRLNVEGLAEFRPYRVEAES